MSEKDFDLLVDYNLLVPRDDWKRQYYSYRESVRIEDPENYTYMLPKSLYLYFKPHTV